MFSAVKNRISPFIHQSVGSTSKRRALVHDQTDVLDPMSVSTYSDDPLEQAGNLASWLVGLGDNDWASYEGSTVEQCKHPARREKIVGLIKASRIEVSSELESQVCDRSYC